MSSVVVLALLLLPFLCTSLQALDQFRLVDATTDDNGQAQMEVLLTNDSGVVRNYVLAVQGDPGVLIEGFNLTGSVSLALGIEFTAQEVSANEGTLAVALDAEFPFDGQSIPVGVDQRIAAVELFCFPPLIPNPATTAAVRFVNGVVGDPPVNNTVTAASSTFVPDTVDAVLTCTPIDTPNTSFRGGMLNLVGGAVETLFVQSGRHKYSFYYTDDDDRAEGFQLLLSHDPRLAINDGFTVENTALALVGTEYIATEELAAGYRIEIIFDKNPPFIDQSLLVAPNLVKIGSFFVSVPSGLTVGTELAMQFDNTLGANGIVVPLTNQLYTQTGRVEVQDLNAQPLVITDAESFVRGDCNGDSLLDISDGIFFLSYLFLSGTAPSCTASCDVNDDAQLDPSDFVRHISFLFLGAATPEFPYPSCGTLLNIDCVSGSGCP